MPPKPSPTNATNVAAQAIVRDPRWAALSKRDATAEGSFVYAVSTTGIYCRPTCPSKRARPENVSFFDTTQSAERAGYRACKRCKPKEPALAERHTAGVAELCRLIESRDQSPTLAELCEHIGMSAFHTHRLFKKVTGVTPRAYAAAHKAQRTRDALETNDTVTDALYRAGHSSSGRFYSTASKRLGMTPTKFKSGGIETEIHFAVGQSSLGAVLVAATHIGLCAIFLGDNPNELVHDLQRRFPNASLVGGDSAFEDTVSKVLGLIEHPQQPIHLPLDIRGTAFQQKVWQALTKIPLGKTATYLELAKAIGLPKGFRAVAQACGANPLAVAIPCHRVVRTDGDLSGYRWGVQRKRTLLEREHARWNKRLNQLDQYLLHLKETNK